MKVVVAAGGTGGHLYPALALVEYIKKQDPNSKFLFIGTKDRLESQVVPQLGYDYVGLNVKGLAGNPLKKAHAALLFVKSIGKAKKVIKKFNPDIVVGFGGYPSASALEAAASLKIKTMIHEQNSIIGLTNKILIKKVDKIICCYQKAYDSYKLANNLLGVAFVLRDIGSSYEYQNQLDSATSYLKKSLEISDENGWNDLSRSLLVCLGNICESQSSYSEAVEYLYKSMSGVEEDNLSYSLYYSLGYLYRQVGLSDSAFYYLNKAMDSSDLYIQCQLNREFSVLFFESKDYETAFEYNERYILLRDSIEHIYQPEKLAEIEARYNYDKLINEKSQLALKKKNAILFFSILILALLFFIFIVFIRYQKIICEKQVIIRDGEIALSKSLSVIEFNKTLLSEKENELKLKMKELEDNAVTIQSLMLEKKQLGESLAQRCKVLNEEIVTLQSEIENKDFLYENKQHELQLKRDELENTEAKIEFIEYEKQQLKSVYSAQADALDKQITILQSDIKAKESVIKNLRNKSRGFLRKYLENNYPQMKKLYDKGDVVVKYSDKEWEVFEELFCSIYPKLIPKLCKNYPKMNKKEQRFCCLLLLGVKTAKISAIMDLEPNTISKYPTNIQEKYFKSYGKKSLEDILLSIV